MLIPGDQTQDLLQSTVVLKQLGHLGNNNYNTESTGTLRYARRGTLSSTDGNLGFQTLQHKKKVKKVKNPLTEEKRKQQISLWISQKRSKHIQSIIDITVPDLFIFTKQLREDLPMMITLLYEQVTNKSIEEVQEMLEPQLFKKLEISDQQLKSNNDKAAK
ncbi:MAG: hypothetical protein EZS28_052682 [Streblomastix strix]|uniref:Uncharacterized protein n=1 Tax=Streblomastix strix TaxID=222440 RepID=A0A5J4RYG3_9EUKA|nr:MAG: hypothetical protein EZS28_052682 [Streblomastix strix]